MNPDEHQEKIFNNSPLEFYNVFKILSYIHTIPSSTTSSSMGDRGQMYHESIVTEFIFSNQLMMNHQNFTQYVVYN